MRGHVRPMVLFLVVAVVLGVGSASAAETGVQPRVSGVWISLLANEEAAFDFAANTPFHLKHGIICDRNATTSVFYVPCSSVVAPQSDTQFYLLRSGTWELEKLDTKPFYTREPTNEPGTMWQGRLKNYPNGLPPGRRTFVVVIMYQGNIEDISATTVNFVAGSTGGPGESAGGPQTR